MNERIQQLAEQAGIYKLNLSDETEYWIMEKFAQLIVQECMNICRYHPSGIVSNNWRVDDVAQDIMSKFQEHFGVDE